MKLKEFARKLGLVLLLYNSFFLIYHFIAAYLTESKTVLVSINHFGEANIEITFWFIILPVLFYGVYKSWNK